MRFPAGIINDDKKVSTPATCWVLLILFTLRFSFIFLRAYSLDIPRGVFDILQPNGKKKRNSNETVEKKEKNIKKDRERERESIVGLIRACCAGVCSFRLELMESIVELTLLFNDSHAVLR